MTRYKQELIKKGKMKVHSYKKDNTTRNSLVITSVILIVVGVLWILI